MNSHGNFRINKWALLAVLVAIALALYVAAFLRAGIFG